MSPPTAVSLIRWLEASVTKKPASAGWYLSSTPCPRNAPPVPVDSFVCVPIGVQPLVVSGITSSSAELVLAFSFLIIRATTSKTVHDCPTASKPAPAPMSRVPKSYKSITCDPPDDKVCDLYCHALEAPPALTPLSSVSVILAETWLDVGTASPSVFVTVADSWIVTLVDDRLRLAMFISPQACYVLCCLVSR